MHVGFGELVHWFYYLAAGDIVQVTTEKRREDIKRKHIFFKRNGGLLLHQHISSSDANMLTKQPNCSMPMN